MNLKLPSFVFMSNSSTIGMISDIKMSFSIKSKPLPKPQNNKQSDMFYSINIKYNSS